MVCRNLYIHYFLALTSLSGVHLTLFFLCFNGILSSSRKGAQEWINLGYICVLFTLGTLGNALNSRWIEMIFVDNINFPGGPLAFSEAEGTDWVLVVCNSVYIVNIFLADGLILFRFFIIWKRYIPIIVVPALSYCATVCLGLLLIMSLPPKCISLPLEFRLQLPVIFWSLSVAFNVLTTLAISGRLLYMRWKLKSTGATTLINPYVSISAMLIESAAVYTINGLVLVISIGLQSYIQILATPVLGQTQSIAPLMIIYRVLQGKAWSMDTHTSLDKTMSEFVAEPFEADERGVQGSGNEDSLSDLVTLAYPDL
ncbi:hypothetical protein CONPUDRAFT_54805 [Coniophora puteana RWD-64-598 SS2]|uniref:Uncharacterized protein n=1 Tax=Coniophora puteana (strain RWD-64-598) TaxID=741705 RepID=A0A5M3MRN5_CONPW|nr:uncharacterized protein CONPUDRAFT_54805 [Coniophora puteana RWD-64-598 SS2]EIW81727.1 hypothetical protein CONPUDRAFT_54805 [Coniophora puteana RWD-64-598 SS2]